MQSRTILFHKTPTSGRTCFYRYKHGGICGTEPLPIPAVVMEPPGESGLSLHPAPLVKQMSQHLGLEEKALEAEGDYHQWVDVAGGPIQVFLLRFTGIDPPHALAEELGGGFVELAQARDLSSVELELLRSAYECVMEG